MTVGVNSIYKIGNNFLHTFNRGGNEIASTSDSHWKGQEISNMQHAAKMSDFVKVYMSISHILVNFQNRKFKMEYLSDD